MFIIMPLRCNKLRMHISVTVVTILEGTVELPIDIRSSLVVSTRSREHVENAATHLMATGIVLLMHTLTCISLSAIKNREVELFS